MFEGLKILFMNDVTCNMKESLLGKWNPASIDVHRILFRGAAGGREASKYSYEFTFKFHPALHVSAKLGYLQEAFKQYEKKLLYMAFYSLRGSKTLGRLMNMAKLGRNAYGNTSMMF
jgi:hypothetical protein